MSGLALILAGHGSHISAETGGIVWRYVDRLRRLGVADEVTACFWKEAPAFSQVLDSVMAADIVVVPVFTAAGYFSGEVIPSEMGLRRGLNLRRNKRVTLTPTIGEHPQLETVVEARLRSMVAQHGLDPAQTAAAIIGHGTARNRQSRATAQQQAGRIRALNWLSQVEAVFLDDAPAIPSIFDMTTAAHIIALPFFIAEGSHVTQDIPRALGANGGAWPQFLNGRHVYYGEPVGKDELICQLILDLARATGLPFAADCPDGAWRGFPAAGSATLMEALETETILRFGQLLISKKRVSHIDGGSASIALTEPSALRKRVREAPFRPLPTRRDLPAGWHVELESPQDAQAVIETVYPGLIADWAAGQRGELATESLREIGTRQSGMFQNIHQLPVNVIERTIELTCGDCIRQPTWRDGWQSAEAGPPCRSACNMWLASARNYEDSCL